MNQADHNITRAQPATILRRLGAFTYDILLLIAILFLATAGAMIVVQGAIPGGHPAYQAFLLLVSFLFYGWFWTHGGQTLGMRAWKIRVENPDGSNITWSKALLRFLLGFLTFGFGLLWCLFDDDKRALYDQLARTRVIMVEKGFVPEIS